MHFKDLGLGEGLLNALEDCGYSTPTPIQEQAIPHILMGRDLVGLAQTGTGKTAGFTLPMIEILAGGKAKARMPRSLILSPTRELAAQIADNFEKYGKYHKLSMALLTGGTSMPEQVKKLERGVDVLIATPGRLLDLFERGNILMGGIKILVIDEADRMLDMGFIPDIEKIVTKISPMRQTLLFSATMPTEIKKLTQKFLSNPREVSVAPAASPAKTVEQFLVRVTKRNKNSVLDKIIQAEDVQNAFIFCNRKRDVDLLAKWLQSHNYSAKALHGDMVQKSRTMTLEEFKTGEISLLVCSDVAARGIDIKGVSHVFNYDVPFHPDDYVHRIGRTGRAGKKGRAWMLATDDEDKVLTAIEKLIGLSIPENTDFADGKAAADRDDKGDKSAGSGRKSSARTAEKKPSSRREGAAKERPGKESPEKESSVKEFAKPSPARSVSSTRPAEKSENRRTRRQNEDQDDNGNSTGFGDDVPAFFR